MMARTTTHPLLATLGLFLLITAVTPHLTWSGDDCGGTCDPCEICNPIDGCVAMPATGCRTAADPRATRLHIRDSTPDLVEFIWKKGAATTKADFGNPVSPSGAGYQLCIYDQSGGTTSLLLSAGAPPDDFCNAQNPKPCWKETKHGFTYLDRDLTPDGLFKIVLKEGLDGKARITVKGKGDNLGITAERLAAIEPPVTAQLKNTAGVCWEATYDVVD